MKYVLLLLIPIYAIEHNISIAPALNYTNWKEATTLGLGSLWDCGTYQPAIQLSFYSIISPNIFTGLQSVLSMGSQASTSCTVKNIYSYEYRVLAGFRHAYNNYETRLWWGVNYRQTNIITNSISDPYGHVGPSWGVSYGHHHPRQNISWHWGVNITPGFYDYSAKLRQLPNSIISFIACEW